MVRIKNREGLIVLINKIVAKLNDKRNLVDMPVGVKEAILIDRHDNNAMLALIDEANKKIKGIEVSIEPKKKSRFVGYGLELESTDKIELTLFVKPTFIEAFLWLVSYMIDEFDGVLWLGMGFIFLFLFAFALVWPLITVPTMIILGALGASASYLSMPVDWL